jgi:MFS family permease
MEHRDRTRRSDEWDSITNGRVRTQPDPRERAMTGLFRNRWWVVFATICGLLVGAGPINVFTFGVFLKPITEDLGLSRGAFSAALTFHAAVAAVVLPIIGWLVDRWGARRIMLPGLLLYALATACYGLLQASPSLFTFLIFALTGLVGGVQSPIPYAAVIARWFDRQRGLALGIGTAGVGLGVALMPQVAALLIDAVGWRLAYVGLAIVVLLVAFPPVALFLREPGIPAHALRRPLPAVTATAVPGGPCRRGATVPGSSGGLPSRFSSTSSRSTER